MSLIRRQNYLSIFLAAITVLAAVISYRTFQQKWLLFREAEKEYQKLLDTSDEEN